MTTKTMTGLQTFARRAFARAGWTAKRGDAGAGLQTAPVLEQGIFPTVADDDVATQKKSLNVQPALLIALMQEAEADLFARIPEKGNFFEELHARLMGIARIHAAEQVAFFRELEKDDGGA